MVYPHEHILLRFNGHFGTSTTVSDKWSVGLRFGFPNIAPVFDAGKLQTFVNSADTATRTMWATSALAAGTNSFFDQVAGAQIGVNGKYLPTTQQTVFSTFSSTAGVGAPAQPWNTALVVSLRTANPRGRASNGRCYLPAIALSPVASTGRIQGSVVDTRLGVVKTWLDALNGAASSYSTGMRVVVASAVGGGAITAVTGIRSDERLDSIERRENDLPAVWHTATLA